jgi:hypothetical protein
MPTIFRRAKWSLWLVVIVALGVLATAAISLGFSKRTTSLSRDIVHFSGSMDTAGSTTLYDDSYFKIKGFCIDLGGGTFRAQPKIKTKTDDAAFTSAVGDANDQDWDTVDGFKKIQADGIAAQGTSAAPDFAAHTNSSFFGAMRSNGKEVLQGFAWSSAFHGATCRWGGYVARVIEG